MNNIMSVGDVAAMLNISMRQTTNLILAGRLHAVKVGPTWIVDRAEAETFASTYRKRERATTRARRASSTDTTATEAQDGAL